MKVVFLDIDGVLCNRAALVTHKRINGMAILDRDTVARLDALCAAGGDGVRIVVSSTWRKFHSRDDIAGHLEHHGLRSGLVHEDWRTVVLDGLRGDEVNEWLSRHPEVTEFIILDDDSDFREAQTPRLVLTSFEPGFTAEDLERALELWAI